MPNPRGYRKNSASQSFSRAEVEAVDVFFATLRRGGDVRRMLTIPAMQTFQRKVTSMRTNMDARSAAAEAEENRRLSEGLPAVSSRESEEEE